MQGHQSDLIYKKRLDQHALKGDMNSPYLTCILQYTKMHLPRWRLKKTRVSALMNQWSVLFCLAPDMAF